MKAEDKRFLAELSAELNEQDTNGQADPRYWVIMDSRLAYAALIDKISGKGTWERNPWVFVYEFELIQ